MSSTDTPQTSPWTVVETKVNRRVIAQVSMRENLHDGVPLYSICVGTVHITPTGGTGVNRHLSIYDVEDAIKLLQELGPKYEDERQRQREEARKGQSSRRYRQAPGL